MRIPNRSTRRWLRVSDPSCTRKSDSVHRRTKAESLVSQVAHAEILGVYSGTPIDGALADIALRINPQPHEDRRAARPLIKDVLRHVASAKHRRDQVRSLG